MGSGPACRRPRTRKYPLRRRLPDRPAGHTGRCRSVHGRRQHRVHRHPERPVPRQRDAERERDSRRHLRRLQPQPRGASDQEFDLHAVGAGRGCRRRLHDRLHRNRRQRPEQFRQRSGRPHSCRPSADRRQPDRTCRRQHRRRTPARAVVDGGQRGRKLRTADLEFSELRQLRLYRHPTLLGARPITGGFARAISAATGVGSARSASPRRLWSAPL